MCKKKASTSYDRKKNEYKRESSVQFVTDRADIF